MNRVLEPQIPATYPQAPATGLSLGLDVADQAINRLAENPAAAAAVPALPTRLAQAPSLVQGATPGSSRAGR